MQSARRHADHKVIQPSGGSVQSDINVTPLVDVCLVLLIIFMVVTPMLQTGVPVQLPETGNPEKYPEGAKQVKVTVDSEGKIYFAKDDWVQSTDALTQRIEADLDKKPDMEYVVKADRRLKYKRVRETMKALNNAGLTKVGLITTKKG